MDAPLPPRLARGKSALSAPLAVLGVGHGGIDSLRQHVNDATVQWGLLRFRVGGGDFQRTKFVSICVNGEDTPGPARGRLATRTKEVLQVMGTIHAGVEVTRGAELTIDFLIQRLLPIFVADSLDATKLKQLYAESVQETDRMYVRRSSSRLSIDLDPENFQSPVVDVEAPAEEEEEENPKSKPNISSEQALEMVALPTAPLNWFLFEPDRFELYNAGSGGIEEMHFALDDSLVLFGVIRFTFKYMQESSAVGFETNVNTAKYYFVHWMGEKTPPVKKSRWNGRKEKAQAFVRTRCAIAISKTAASCDDLDLRSMIQDLYRFTAVETECEDAERSVEAYLAAIAEEQEQREHKALERLALEPEDTAVKPKEEEPQREEESPKPKPNKVKEELPSATAAILEVRNACGKWDWVLLAAVKPG